MTRRFLTSGDPARICDQYDDGVIVRIIAENLGISERTVYRVLRNRETEYRRPHMAEDRVDESVIAKAAEHVRNGATMKEAAAAVGINCKTYADRSPVRPTPEQAKASRSRAQRARYARNRAKKDES